MKKSKYIDHTLLKPTATKDDIKKLCQEAIENDFYSVCVNPCFVEYASELLQGTDVKVACVVGFPLGANTTKLKKIEAFEAVANGASEIDMVINQGYVKQGDYDKVLEEINEICDCGALVKVIIETSQLSEQEIENLCDVVNKSFATYIKTSTGFVGEGAKFEHVELMRKCMNANKKVKASGGIRDKETFEKMIALGAERIGTSSGTKLI